MSAIADAFRACRRSLVALGVFSFFLNILMLTPMFYMINIFDKAVGTGSMPTLIALAALAIFLYLMLAVLDWTRSIVMVHVGVRLDRILAPLVYETCFRSESGAISAQGVGYQPLVDLNNFRQFISGAVATAIFDLPWIPIYLILMLLFHPVLAAVALVCMVIMAIVAVANQRATTAGLENANKLSTKIAGQTQKNLRNAEVAAAMGMMSALTSRWRLQQDEMLSVQAETSGAAAGFSSVIKTLNLFMQSAAITTGAILAMAQEISPGVMIGAALLLGKTIQPIQQVVGGWRSFVDARAQYDRLSELLERFPDPEATMALPPITGSLTADSAFVTPPGAKYPTLRNITFDLPAGTMVMILGPSAAGKSSLVRAMLGLWPVERGSIRLDGADAERYDRSELGPQVGYLPQDIELFDGTVAENIARFGDVDPEAVVQASKDADVHDMILCLPQGYDTVITGSQGLLSQGQKQRVALARAMYGRPKLLVLDEPNSNLDEGGEVALNKAIQTMKTLGSTVVLVSHRKTAMPLANHIILMKEGKIVEQGSMQSFVEKARERQQQLQTTEGAKKSSDADAKGLETSSGH